MHKKKWTGMAAALFFLAQAAICAACSTKAGAQAVTGVKLGKDGSVTATIAETFDREYYTEDGLRAMIQSELAAYDSTGEKVTLTEMKKQEEEAGIVVVMEYASSQDYAAFNEVTFFCGTVAEAQKAGYMKDAVLTAASDTEKTLQKEELSALAEKQVVIFSEPMQVQVPTKVLYLSAGSRLVDGKCVEASGDGALTYIIMK